MDKIHALLDTIPELDDQINRRNNSEITFRNGSRILSLPNNPDRLRAYSATDIYLDEAAHFLNDEPVMRAINPMLIATQGTLTIISTPFGKRGLFWENYQRATNNQSIDPTVKAYDLCPSTISPLITKAHLERERQMLTDLEFRQEYLGEFLEEVDVYFPIDLITPCVNPALQPLDRAQPQKSFYYGIDFAKQRDETAVIVLEKAKQPGGSSKLIVRQWFTWAHMNYSDQIGHLSQLRKQLPCQKCKADQSGVGEAIIENLKQAVPQKAPSSQHQSRSN
jgi:phage FluMu gp28-like protein